MPFQTVIQDTIPEAVTAQIAATIVDELGVAISSANLTTLIISIYDQVTNVIINAKDDTDIKNLNGGTIHATNGALTYTLTPADNLFIGSAADEVHVALIEWTYDTGNKTGRHEVLFKLKNMNRVP